DQVKCRGCGRCTDICPKGAISLSFDPSVTEKEVRRIVEKFKSTRIET
ncbi:MAG: 4Fe-4S binding protein, partial [Candidatus Methanomethylophilaceae archaeon]|nr:4Fe-4S binding protein [Candidatus Methanomethylophilaceae archaeon]